MNTSQITLIGAPFGRGSPRAGCQMGPEALRIAGLREALETLGHATTDIGDLGGFEARGGPIDGIEHGAEAAAWIGASASSVAGALGRGAAAVLLGGDHTLGAGGALGAASHWAEEGRPLFTVWIDAHGDYNTPATSPSGAAHGMALAAACGEPGVADLLRNAPAARLDPSHVFMLGLRSVDAGEKRLLRERGVQILDMRGVDEFGVVAPLRGFLERVAAAKGALHVSFDLDALDPEAAPGVGTPAPGGLSYREAHLAMELLHDSELIRSVDLVELNPFLDDRGRSARLMVDLAASLFGRRILDPA